MGTHQYTHYISGPMRGKPDHNRATFMAVEDALRNARPMDKVINPCRNFDGVQTLSVVQYMEQDLKQVIEADQIVLLPGWETSQGALREIELGKWLSKDFALAGVGDDGSWRFEPIGGAPEVDPSPRAAACDEAKSLITGDRNNQYGPPTQDFKRTAAMANGFGFRVVTHDGAEPELLKAHHVAIFMMLLKTSRLAWTPAKRDSWVDDIGYAGCGYECAVEEEAEALAAMNAPTELDIIHTDALPAPESDVPGFTGNLVPQALIDSLGISREQWDAILADVESDLNSLAECE